MWTIKIGSNDEILLFSVSSWWTEQKSYPDGGQEERADEAD